MLEVFAPGRGPDPRREWSEMASNVPLPAEHVVFEPSWSAVPAHLADARGRGHCDDFGQPKRYPMMGPEVLALLERRERDARNQDVDRGLGQARCWIIRCPRCRHHLRRSLGQAPTPAQLVKRTCGFWLLCSQLSLCSVFGSFYFSSVFALNRWW